MPGAARNRSVDPVAQAARCERDPRSAGIDIHLLPCPIDRDADRHLQRPRVGGKRILRTLDRRVDPIACDGHRHPDSPLFETLAGQTRREEDEGPLRAEQIRDRHGTQLGPVEAIGRKRDRDAEDRAPDPVLAQHGPERLGLAQQAQLGPPAGYPEASQPEEPLDAAEVRRRQQGQVGSPVAVEEIEDVVSPWLGAGAERRPGDRRHRREGGPQPSIAARLRELLEVRQQPLLHEPIGEYRVLAVETDDDEPPDEGARRLAAAQASPEHAKRPEEQCCQGSDRRREEREERRQQREARAGPDVRVGRLRRAHQQHERGAQDCRRPARSVPSGHVRPRPGGSSLSASTVTMRSTHSATVSVAVSRDRSGATGTS